MMYLAYLCLQTVVRLRVIMQCYDSVAGAASALTFVALRVASAGAASMRARATSAQPARESVQEFGQTT